MVSARARRGRERTCTPRPPPSTASPSSCTPRTPSPRSATTRSARSSRARSRAGRRSTPPPRARSPSSTRRTAARRSRIFLAHLDLDPARLKSARGDRREPAGHQDGRRQPRSDRLRFGSAPPSFALSIDMPLRMVPPLGPVAASSETVADGTYGAVRALNLVTLGPPQDPRHRRLPRIRITSEKVHDLVKRSHIPNRRRRRLIGATGRSLGELGLHRDPLGSPAASPH